jgi:peptide/nickel transport system substrate-binding protein
MTRIDRRLLFTSGAAAALLAATGVSAQVAPHRGGRLRAALSGANRDDHWGATDNLFMQAARGAVFETLTEIVGDGTLRGDIAQSWETLDGGTTWVFDLNPSVKFHDDVDLHVDDVVALFERHIVLDVSGVKAKGKNCVMVTLNAANQSFPYQLADPEFAVLPRQAERKAAGIGTGLYRVQKFHAGQHFIGARVAKHRKDTLAGWFDYIELTSISSEQVRAEALRKGMIDVADITVLDDYSDPTEYQFLPSTHATKQIACRTIFVPNVIGTTWELDNTRMATRWWMA